MIILLFIVPAIVGLLLFVYYSGLQRERDLFFLHSCMLRTLDERRGYVGDLLRVIGHTSIGKGAASVALKTHSKLTDAETDAMKREEMERKLSGMLYAITDRISQDTNLRGEPAIRDAALRVLNNRDKLVFVNKSYNDTLRDILQDRKLLLIDMFKPKEKRRPSFHFVELF